jgi:hypothetical protein
MANEGVDIRLSGNEKFEWRDYSQRYNLIQAAPG